MFNKLIALLDVVKRIGYITNVNMTETYASIDFHNDGTKYLLTLMTIKEEKENDSI